MKLSEIIQKLKKFPLGNFFIASISNNSETKAGRGAVPKNFAPVNRKPATARPCLRPRLHPRPGR
jgi:hypothetical protein